MQPSDAQQTMTRETRLTLGPIPRDPDFAGLAEQSWRLVGDRFVLRAEGEHWFHYRKGSGVTVERGAGAIVGDEELWLNGSVYAAVACLNGLLPIHASAVAHEGRVYAFTGHSGAGKSTLVTALGHHGLPMFCDDTLVLDLDGAGAGGGAGARAGEARVACLPGHKRLKLTPEALALTGARAQERVCADLDKFYAVPPFGDVGTVLPLGALVFLEEGDEEAFLPITGAERIARLQDDHYTARLFLAARGMDRGALFGHLAALARRIPMARFVRPRDTARFASGVALAAEYVKGLDSAD